MVRKLKVGVIFGGRSGEHEISLMSAGCVIDAMDRSKYDIVPIAITKEGKWLSPPDAARLLAEPTRRLLPDGMVRGTSRDIALVGDPSQSGLLSLDSNDNSRLSLDIVFPVLHGTYGEDGTLQGLLDLAGVPYVGCGVLASSCGMDKVAMKSLFRDAGLPICKYVWFLRSEWEREPASIKRRVRSEIGFPCFVKPANLGSSVGISHAANMRSLETAIELAGRYDRKIIVEEELDAREIECAVIGNDEPSASLPGEYVIHDQAAKFLDYDEKYTSTGHVEFVVPSPLPKATIEKIRRMAVKAFKSVDGSGLARVDFFLRRDTRELLINELNTMPGLTIVSGYPKMWAASGLKFPKVIDRLIELGFERHRDKSRNITHR